MEHRLDIILKLQIKKVPKTVEMIIQNFTLMNLLQLILCHIPWLIVEFFNLVHAKFTCDDRKM
jgi:hypothetical protein